MAPIKSALELALEKTKDLKVDQKAIAEYELKQEAKRLTGEFFNSQDPSELAKTLKALPKEKQAPFKTGAFDILASRIQLPSSKIDDFESTLALVCKGFCALNAVPSNDRKIEELFKQLGAFLKRFVEDAQNLETALRKQYEPKLRRKEQELAARTGQMVRLDAMSDPEFVALFQKNAGQLKGQYQTALDDAKLQLGDMLGIEKKEEV